MEPVERTPTERTDYALISATYGTLLAGTAFSARGKAQIPVAELPALAAASFALSKLLVKEKAETWVRAPFVDEAECKPKGRRMRYAVGELLTCTRCVGVWSALGLTALRVTRPREARVVNAVLGASAINDVAQAGFTWLCSRANAPVAPPAPVEPSVRRFSRPAAGE